MPNRLAQESSPYLLQHAENPVDWYPWGEEALQRARDEGKPIFLSIGYSACHWCHVMEHESFEDDQIASGLNERFVCIKVDREERPDLDQIYMTAIQMLTGRGGWPMSVFLTPDLKPFYGGTYWPPRAARGMPGFDQILEAVHDAWVNRREKAYEAAEQITQHIQHLGNPAGEMKPLTAEPLRIAESKLERIFDREHGGFGEAPKFPRSMDLQLLLRQWKRQGRSELLEMVKLTLDKMARGGIYDHLGGGFARYSVDEKWLVPHFEKMLYDNALLGGAYLDAYQVTGEQRYALVVRETMDYVLETMTDTEGGFYSSEDADSEGEEGKFYVWSQQEVREVLEPELGVEIADQFCYLYDVTEEGNFEGKTILNLPQSIPQAASSKHWDLNQLVRNMATARELLRTVRSRRVRPAKDDKILTSWNALMIDTMARAGQILEEPRYADAARRTARFLLEKVRRTDGRLLHSYRNGKAQFDAYLDDYSFLINALVTLYESDFDETWLNDAESLCDIVLKHFADESGSGFFYTADDHEKLIARNKDFFDASIPSGNAMAAVSLFRMGKLTGRDEFLTAAEATLKMAADVLQEPLQSSQMLIALDMWIGPFQEAVVWGSPDQAETRELLREIHQRYHPNRVLACRATEPEEDSPVRPLFVDRASENAPTLYICEGATCQPPATGAEAAIREWRRLSDGPAARSGSSLDPD